MLNCSCTSKLFLEGRLRLTALGLFTLIFYIPQARANNIQADMAAVIIDIFKMDTKEAKRLCKEEPFLLQCDVKKEEVKTKNGNYSYSDPVRFSMPETYDIISANFE